MSNKQPYQHDELPDLLRELKTRGDGFRRPSADQFADLAEHIIFAEATQKMPKQHTAKIRRLSVRWIVGAAAAVLLLVMWQSWSTTDEVHDQPAVVAAKIDDLSDEDILAYIDDNIQDFELDILADEIEDIIQD